MDNANQNRVNARANRRNGHQEHEIRVLKMRIAGLQTRLKHQNIQIKENAGKDRTFPIFCPYRRHESTTPPRMEN